MPVKRKINNIFKKDTDITADFGEGSERGENCRKSFYVMFIYHHEQTIAMNVHSASGNGSAGDEPHVMGNWIKGDTSYNME